MRKSLFLVPAMPAKVNNNMHFYWIINYFLNNVLASVIAAAIVAIIGFRLKLITNLFHRLHIIYRMKHILHKNGMATLSDPTFLLPNSFSDCTINLESKNFKATTDTILSLEDTVFPRNRFFQLFAISGPYGYGKSHLISFLSSKAVVNLSKYGYFVAPIEVSRLHYSNELINRLQDNNPAINDDLKHFIDIFANYIGSTYFPSKDHEIIAKILYSKARKGRLLLILDGLDQFPGAERETNTISPFVSFIAKFLSIHIPKNSTSSDKMNGNMVILSVRDEFLQQDDSADGHWHNLTREKNSDDIKAGCLILQIKGFTKTSQIESFVNTIHKNEKQSADPQWPCSDYISYLTWLHDIEQENEALCSPIVGRLILDTNPAPKIPTEGSITPVGTTLTQVYSYRFKNLLDNKALKQVCHNYSSLAYVLYNNNKYFMDYSSIKQNDLSLTREEIQSMRKYESIIILHPKGAQFCHATYRDYFCALYMINALRGGESEKERLQVFGDRKLHYLVAEFMAGLMDRQIVDILIAEGMNYCINDKESVNVRMGALDLLWELEDSHKAMGSLKRAVSNRLKILQDRDWDMEKSYFVSIAGRLGINTSMLEELNTWIQQQGVLSFIDIFYSTQNGFFYYGESPNKFVREWLKLLSKPAMGDFRKTIVIVLGLYAEINTNYLQEIEKAFNSLQETLESHDSLYETLKYYLKRNKQKSIQQFR